MQSHALPCRPHATLAVALTAALTVPLTLGACRAEADPVDPRLLEYEVDSPFDPEPLEGPDPWVEGERRFNIGLFYEGGSTDFAPIDGVSSNYFIFDLADGTLTYDQIEDPDRIEGLHSSRIVRTGTPFLGGGIVWSAPRNMASWATMHLSLKSDDDSFQTVGISMETEGGNVTLSMADYGFVNDGEWHTLAVPLIDFEDGGADLTRVTAPFLFASDGGPSGELFKVDGLYLTAD